MYYMAVALDDLFGTFLSKYFVEECSSLLVVISVDFITLCGSLWSATIQGCDTAVENAFNGATLWKRPGAIQSQHVGEPYEVVGNVDAKKFEGSFHLLKPFTSVLLMCKGHLHAKLPDTFISFVLTNKLEEKPRHTQQYSI